MGFTEKPNRISHTESRTACSYTYTYSIIPHFKFTFEGVLDGRRVFLQTACTFWQFRSDVSDGRS